MLAPEPLYTHSPHAPSTAAKSVICAERAIYGRTLGFEFCLQGRAHTVQDAQLNTPGKLLADGGYRR